MMPLVSMDAVGGALLALAVGGFLVAFSFRQAKRKLSTTFKEIFGSDPPLGGAEGPQVEY